MDDFFQSDGTSILPPPEDDFLARLRAWVAVSRWFIEFAENTVGSYVYIDLITIPVVASLRHLVIFAKTQGYRSGPPFGGVGQ